MNAPRDVALEGPRVPRTRLASSPRVAVVADQRLIGQTVGEALRASGFSIRIFPVPAQNSGVRDLKERMARQQVSTALLLNDRRDWAHTSRAMRTIRGIPQVAWLLLSEGEDRARWGAALEAGAVATCPLTIGLEQLSDHLRTVLAGGQLTAPERRAALVRDWERHREFTDRLDRLTLRERQVLDSLRQGHGVTEIAVAAFVSVGTVRSQVSAVLAKLEVPSQIAAVALLERVSAVV